MSIAPHSGIIDFGVFTPPGGGLNGIQGEVPAPLLIEAGYVLTAEGWSPAGSISGLGTMALEDANAVAITGGSIQGTQVLPRISDQNTVSSPFSWNSDNSDVIAIDLLANDLTISADAGVPDDGQKMIFRICDNGVSRVITFDGGVAKGFRPVGTSLTPSGGDFLYSTVVNKVVYFGCIFNSQVNRWDIIALSQEA